MDSFFVRFKNPLVLIAIVLAQVIALATQLPAHEAAIAQGGAPDGRKVSVLRHWISAMVTPVEKTTHATSQGTRGLLDHYVFLMHTARENDALKQEVARLRQEQEEMAVDAAEGRRLEKLLDFQHQYVTKTVAAQVVGVAGSDRSRMVMIDKGAVNGLKPDMAVITPDGVVGKLRDVFPHTAQLLLLNDSTAGAGVILESTRIRGIVHGTTDGKVVITNLTADSRIKPGEKVLTSGGDMVFPRGLPLGEVVSIAPDAKHQPYVEIVIKPWANLYQLEEVLVITGTDAVMPSAMQQDAAQALDSGPASKRAAEIIAEKLPSLHADETTGANGATGAPTAVLPKPEAVVHPDKYSPNAPPPAAEMKPGAPR